MRKRPIRTSMLILLLSLTMVLPPGLLAQTSSAGPQPGHELTWPRVHQEPGLTIFIYQPQIEQWKGDRIEARMAVGMQKTGAKAPVYGVVWMTARTDVDKAASIVMIRDIALTKASFPTEPSKEGEYLSVLRKYFSKGPKAVALDHLEASFAISQAAKQAQGVPVKNTPPRIIFSSVPALLVLIDGAPVLRPVEGGAERIINTNALILKFGGRFYLSAMNHWYEAPDVKGPWTVTASAPASLEPIKQSLAAAQQVDLMTPSPGSVLPPNPPVIYVSTVPAEVIQSDGQPEFLPIEGTGLLQVKNSDNIIFMDVSSNYYYVLISGRWFQSKSLNGPWAFVVGKNLPADFAKIPPDHPRANALVSVPGTPQAEEAVIAN
ncbi:MAG TPA: carbohydrate-binding family V/XII, partial [Nitrospiria bacterium]|nr:carbohydrate-binding family V/XII [Nitrospiria bacterium]